MDLARFALAIFDPERDGEVVSCQDYLVQFENGRVTWLPDQEDSAIMLFSGGREWLADRWNFGNLALIVRQLSSVYERLQRMETAILRSAVLEQPYAPYLLFEPDAQPDADLVLISEFFILDPGAGRDFPVRYWSGREPERLFDYVAQHRSQLLEDDPFPRPGKPRLKELPFPYSVLMNSLPEQVSLGERVIELVDKGTAGKS